MKRFSKLNWLFAALLFCSISQSVFSQTLNEFFNNSELHLTYLGIDYTKAKLINDPAANTFDIRNRLYTSINNLIVTESKKYDISAAFRKSNFSSDLTAVKAKNEKINAEDITSNNSEDFNRLKESDISAVAKGLSLSGKTGIGLLFVVEGMKKAGAGGEASVWVVLMDLKSKKVLMTERFETKAKGFGFRNLWASPIKNIIDMVEKSKYKEWKEKNGTNN